MNQQIEVTWPSSPPDYRPQEAPPKSWVDAIGTVQETGGRFRYHPETAESEWMFRLIRPF